MQLIFFHTHKEIYQKKPSISQQPTCRADWHLHTVPEHLHRFPCQVYFLPLLSPPRRCLALGSRYVGVLYWTQRPYAVTSSIVPSLWQEWHCILSWRACIEIVPRSHLGHTPDSDRFFWGNKVCFVVTGRPVTATTESSVFSGFMMNKWNKSLSK